MSTMHPEHPATKCRRPLSSRRLTAYADGTLPLREMDAIRAHLPGCPECAAMVALEFRITRALRSLPAWEAPAGITAAVLARTGMAPARAYRRLSRWMPALRIAVPSMLVLALLVVLKVSGVLAFAASLTSLAAVGFVREVAGIMDHAAVALDPIAKVLEASHPERITRTAFRAMIETPPVGFGMTLVLVMLIVVVIGLRRHAARTPGGIRHAGIVL